MIAKSKQKNFKKGMKKKKSHGGPPFKKGSNKINKKKKPQGHSASKKGKKPKNSQPSKQTVEKKFENSLSKAAADSNLKNVKLMLPTKSREGLLEKQLITQFEAMPEDCTEEPDIPSDDESLPLSDIEEEEYLEPVSTIQLMADREKKLKMIRYQIGLFSSEILENPTLKHKHLQTILHFMDERTPGIYVTVKKLATASLLEIFKDILPSYTIKIYSNSDQKLKKETLELQNYESALLKYYKQYLQKMEKMANCLKKIKNIKSIKEQDLILGIFAIRCMCNLLIAQPYFNYSSNVAMFLIPYLDNKIDEIRTMVADSFSQLFKEDKRGDISLIIVRSLNKYLKVHKNLVHAEVTSILLNLRITSVDLSVEEANAKKVKKLISHKNRIIALSKKERKRKKKLEEVEKELLETKGEDDKRKKQKVFTDITNILFTIYFRILKQVPNSRVLLSCLEGLSKFAHCINIDFYNDLIDSLDNLFHRSDLSMKVKLHCIHVAANILSNQTSMLNIDCIRFYTYLYQNLLNVHIGRSHVEVDIVLKTLQELLVNRCKNVTTNRLLAFIKRMATVSLNSHHNSTLGFIRVIELLFQKSKTAEIILDTDPSIGDSTYLPELQEPEHCNPQCSSLWELVALLRHYHGTVRSFAKYVMSGTLTGENVHIASDIPRKPPVECCELYDPMSGNFNPTLVPPKKLNPNNSRNISITYSIRKRMDAVDFDLSSDVKSVDLFSELQK